MNIFAQSADDGHRAPATLCPNDARIPVLFASPADDADAWRAALAVADRNVTLVHDAGAAGRADRDLAGIRHALVFRPPTGLLRAMPDLSVVFALTAGVDDLLTSGEIPDDVVLVRMADPALKTAMTHFVCAQVLLWSRDLRDYADNQRHRVWAHHPTRPVHEIGVGVLGLGALGGAAATALAGLGFSVGGWSMRPRDLPGVRSYTGADGLLALAARSHILVCLLPLTPATRGILNRALFAAMPPASVLVNVGRGGHLVERDLVGALAQGQLRGASLDVFGVEPLPAGHPFWRMPGIALTPHVAANTHPASAARFVADNLARATRGEPMLGVVDRTRGY